MCNLVFCVHKICIFALNLIFTGYKFGIFVFKLVFLWREITVLVGIDDIKILMCNKICLMCQR